MRRVNALGSTTIILPIDLGSRPIDIILKALRICREGEKYGWKIVIGLAVRNIWPEIIFKRVIGKFPNISIVETAHAGPVNNARLRNSACKVTESKYLIFLDVDIWPDHDLFYKYQNKIEKDELDFVFIPCMYLSQYGSKRLISERDPKSLRDRYFNFSRKEFLHLANPSSVTIMRSQDFSSLGGFDEQFEGHGYEDFDFMLRLAGLYNSLTECGKILDAGTARSPLFPTGFRRALGRLCLPLLIDKDMAFHLYHDTPKQTKYYAARTGNLERFLTQHQHLTSTHPESSTLIEDFLSLCRLNNLDYKDYSALFENKPGHIDRFDTFKRRLRFLLK
ncbi:putative glycosyltransferase involved in capsule biosynthesis [Pseudomonas putida]|nr:putative glycosyltransferase involved in capsule biosynthesis [Pseudomonas putida]